MTTVKYRGKTLFTKYSSVVKQLVTYKRAQWPLVCLVAGASSGLIRECGSLSIAHQLWKGKKKFDGTLKNFWSKSFSEISGKFCFGQKPTFISNLYIIFIIFFIIVRIKSGKVGKKPANPHKYWVFRGQNAKIFWPFAHFFWPKTRFLTLFQNRPKKCPKKVGRKWARFSTSEKISGKSGLKKGPFFQLPKSCFFCGKPQIGYVRTLFKVFFRVLISPV